MWTIEELVERVGRALAAQYPGAPNGRVRELPDRRAVRWYATTGLVDRPTTMRGRTALYGRRHLLQLVAVKRRQAAGRTLAQIQAELAGASDSVLAAIAAVPEELLTDDDRGGRSDAAPARPRFWAGPPPAPAAQAPAPVEDGPVTAPEGPPGDRPAASPLAGVALGAGVVLLLPGRPGDGDYAAIADAARPLLDLLAARGLSAPMDGSSQ